MPRIRQIKPEFFLDDELGQCSRDARLLFIGLWPIADREGRLENRPAKIKAQVFPYDTDISHQKVTALLDQLAIHNFLIPYTINNHNYLQIRTFSKHQHCHLREPESVIPAPLEAPDKAGACMVPQLKPGASTVLAPDKPGGFLSIGIGANAANGVLVPGKPGAIKRSHRAPEDFQVTLEMREWAKNEVPDANIEAETRIFRDHQFKDAKTDWQATWRNWLRNSARFRTGSKPKQKDILDMQIAQAEEEERGKHSSDKIP